MDLDSFSASNSDVAGFFGSQDDGTKKREPKHVGRRLVDLPRHGDGERFIRGPIPMAWLQLAARCGNRALAVALLLWYAAAWQRSNPAKLSKSILAEFRVHPKTAKRVLVRMAGLGLVEVEFHRGRSPKVTILDPKQSPAT